jgi:hypothetical protein
MKKLLITMAATLVCVGAFAQGKIGFATDGIHLAYFSTDTAKLNTGDSALGGRGLYTVTISSLAGAPSLVADLWAGTSATTLAKVSSAPSWSAVAEGRWTGVNTILPSTPAFPAGTVAFFQVQIHDSRAVDAASAWLQNGWYAGQTTVFQATPGPTAYSSIANVSTAAPFSTWGPGTQQITGMAAGNFGAIEVFATIPEPGTFALAGLGLASLLIFRRRK